MTALTETEVVTALSALAHPHRLQVFRALVVAGPTGLMPSNLATRLDIARNTLSFHLKELSHAGLVTAEQQGRHLIYRAAYERMNALLGFLTENCCAGEACAVQASGSCCDD